MEKTRVLGLRHLSYSAWPAVTLRYSAGTGEFVAPPPGHMLQLTGHMCPCLLRVFTSENKRLKDANGAAMRDESEMSHRHRWDLRLTHLHFLIFCPIWNGPSVSLHSSTAVGDGVKPQPSASHVKGQCAASASLRHRFWGRPVMEQCEAYFKTPANYKGRSCKRICYSITCNPKTSASGSLVHERSRFITAIRHGTCRIHILRATLLAKNHEQQGTQKGTLHAVVCPT
jgi:hypothetical protein